MRTSKRSDHGLHTGASSSTISRNGEEVDVETATTNTTRTTTGETVMDGTDFEAPDAEEAEEEADITEEIGLHMNYIDKTLLLSMHRCGMLTMTSRLYFFALFPLVLLKLSSFAKIFLKIFTVMAGRPSLT